MNSRDCSTAAYLYAGSDFGKIEKLESISISKILARKTILAKKNVAVKT
jgi:hypothetical protein